MTLIELLFASGLGSLLLAGIATLYLLGLQSFATLGNYAALSGQSRISLDRISKEIRSASRLVACESKLPTKWLKFTNSVERTTTVYTWDSVSQVLTCTKTGEPDTTYLKGCSAWDFTLYQRSPTNNWTFVPTANPATCKLINMSWKCSRAAGTRTATENVVTAQIVMRNKP